MELTWPFRRWRVRDGNRAFLTAAGGCGIFTATRMWPVEEPWRWGHKTHVWGPPAHLPECDFKSDNLWTPFLLDNGLVVVNKLNDYESVCERQSPQTFFWWLLLKNREHGRTIVVAGGSRERELPAIRREPACPAPPEAPEGRHSERRHDGQGGSSARTERSSQLPGPTVT